MFIEPASGSFGGSRDSCERLGSFPSAAQERLALLSDLVGADKIAGEAEP